MQSDAILEKIYSKHYTIKCFTENDIAKFQVTENFYSDLLRNNIGLKSNNYQSFLTKNIIA